MKKHDTVKILEKLGWTLKITGGGHIKAVSPVSGRFVILSATPSDKRARLNMLRDLRRHGVDLEACK